MPFELQESLNRTITANCARKSDLHPHFFLPGTHKHTRTTHSSRQQQLPDGSLKGTVCDASDVKPSRRGEMPQCVRSESTKEGKDIGGWRGARGQNLGESNELRGK